MASELEAVKHLQEEVTKGKEVLNEVMDEGVKEAAKVSKGKEVLNEEAQKDVNVAAKVSKEKGIMMEEEQEEEEIVPLVSEGAKESAAIPEKIVLLSSDGQEFEVFSAMAMQSGTIKNMIEDGVVENSVPVPNVTASVLAKVIDYWNARVSLDSSSEEWKAYEKEFVKVEQDEMFEIIMAANYLDTKPLLDLTSQTVADTIKDMSVEEVREYFGIENDFTPEEEAKIRAENSWAFDE